VCEDMEWIEQARDNWPR